MALHLSAHRAGFGLGYTPITTFGEAEHDTGIALGVLKLSTGEVLDERAPRETAWLLMEGAVRVTLEGEAPARLTRASLFDDGPSAVHVAAGARVKIVAETDCELTVYGAENDKPFPPALYLPRDVSDEPRGKGTVGDACLRIVRTIFDGTNTHEHCALVLGEVVTLPGRWSSYPPHHHPQPELYHYRFTRPEGYGHAELGDDVLKVRHNDTVKIFPPHTHAQCAAPGYGMYYSWVIRHLPGERYTTPTFEPAHDWTRDPKAPYWRPRGLDET